jgi:hypothetical protein
MMEWACVNHQSDDDDSRTHLYYIYTYLLAFHYAACTSCSNIACFPICMIHVTTQALANISASGRKHLTLLNGSRRADDNQCAAHQLAIGAQVGCVHHPVRQLFAAACRCMCRQPVVRFHSESTESASCKIKTHHAPCWLLHTLATSCSLFMQLLDTSACLHSSSAVSLSFFFFFFFCSSNMHVQAQHIARTAQSCLSTKVSDEQVTCSKTAIILRCSTQHPPAPRMFQVQINCPHVARPHVAVPHYMLCQSQRSSVVSGHSGRSS